MNEQEQNMSLDELIDKCPMFKGYIKKWHNVEIKPSSAYTLCEIDDLYEYPDFVLLGENKCNDKYACHKKMESQIVRFKRYENCIQKYLGISRKPVQYFFAHFENDKLHIEYKGVKILYKNASYKI